MFVCFERILFFYLKLDLAAYVAKFTSRYLSEYLTQSFLYHCDENIARLL